MGASDELRKWLFFYPVLPSFITFIFAGRWCFHAGPAPDTVKADLLWLLPLGIPCFYNFGVLVFLSIYYTEDYIKGLPTLQHVLRLSVHKFFCASNLTLVASFLMWSCLKLMAAEFMESLREPGGGAGWFVFLLTFILALIPFLFMGFIWLESGVFEDFEVYSKNAADVSTPVQTKRIPLGREKIKW
ncbi:hypothetical protein NHQ30_008733 [Ciborinia camelliae]|nr:hypothetical protein NHQ30_008733 [Ciborinia camelliae]